MRRLDAVQGCGSRTLVWGTLCLAWTIAALAPADAKGGTASRFDGRWVVHLAGAGGCGLNGSDYKLRIRGGRIRLSGGSGASGRGSVDTRGAISINAARGFSDLKASGKLRGRSGGGRWSVSPIGCSGKWRASKR